MPKSKKTQSQSSKGGNGSSKSSGATASVNRAKPNPAGGASSSHTDAKNIGAAVKRSRMQNIGMRDLLNHVISWIAGYIYVGNGTLGATDQIYFQPQGSTTTIVNGIVPVAGADADVGQSYIADIEKHYARKRVHNVRVDFHSLVPSTANSMELVVAPTRGAFGIVNSGLATTAPLAQLYSNVVSMAGALSCASWEDLALNLAQFVAGGYGAKQNEFDINNPQTPAVDINVLGQNAELVIPCGFVVTGTNSTTGLRGTRTHAVVVTQKCDFIDFVGGEAAASPVGRRPSVFAALTRHRQMSNVITQMCQSSAAVSGGSTAGSEPVKDNKADEKSALYLTGSAQPAASESSYARTPPTGGFPGWVRVDVDLKPTNKSGTLPLSRG